MSELPDGRHERGWFQRLPSVPGSDWTFPPIDFDALRYSRETPYDFGDPRCGYGNRENFSSGHDSRFQGFPPVEQHRLLSHAEAEVAGHAMCDRWERMLEEGEMPMLREDTGWADLARVAWEAVWAERRK